MDSPVIRHESAMGTAGRGAGVCVSDGRRLHLFTIIKASFLKQGNTLLSSLAAQLSSATLSRACELASAMASGEAEPLQYTTTVLRVSIHCEGCKKKVKKVLQNIEGVYKVTIDAAQHKVTVTSSVGDDALIRRLHKSGKQATMWPSPPVAAAKKPEEIAAPPPAPPAAESGKGAEKAEKKPKEAAKETEAESSEMKPEKDKVSDKKAEKAEAKKPKDDAKKDGEVAEKKEKGGSAEPAKEVAAEEAGGEESGGKKGKKKKNKQKDAGEVDAPPAEKPTKPQPPSMPAPAPALSPERFPYYAPQPVMSYNVAHPSSSVSYYAPTPVMSMQPMPMPPPPPPQMSYGYSPYPPMMPPPPEYLYGPPGMRSSPPQESYNNMFNVENPNSCSIM
ncbi:hypothetical protein GUJ93_ZPchr0007g4885 [Zizania palustris]|uniref:HMA domain-containing protein n=1 Tax=Zizania palustris TaxID=103762 RepID=A0A8J5ST22_ZIZPA|nr:hypothetical protein GUJ93_ZPchr0007g4885 [Zizania palustris]